jgi:hypothetical protein
MDLSVQRFITHYEIRALRPEKPHLYGGVFYFIKKAPFVRRRLNVHKDY